MTTELVRTKLAATFEGVLQTAVLNMPNGSRPKRLSHYWNDLHRENRVRPLGRFPEAAQICLSEGAPLCKVVAPLKEMESYLESLVPMPKRSLGDVLVEETREEAEANIAQMQLAECAMSPDAYAIEIFIKEMEEQIEAAQIAVKVARSLRYSR